MSLRKFAIVIAAASMAGALAFGCSSSSTSATPEDAGGGSSGDSGAKDSGRDAQGSSSGDSGGGDSAVACVPLTTVGSWTPTWKPPVRQEACTQANIDDFFRVCVSSATATQADCTSYTGTAAGKTCAACLETADTATSYGPLIAHQSQHTVELNLAGCVALADNDVTANGCGAKYLAASECGNQACVNCPAVNDQASLDALNQCTSDSEKGACQTYATAAGCVDQEAEAGNAAVANCFAGKSFDEIYANIAPLFCLKTATDAGGDGG